MSAATKLYDNLSERALREAIEGGRELLDSLPENERNYVIKWLSDAVVDGNAENSLHQAIWEIDYLRKPVGIEQFLEDDYYLGRAVRDTLYPIWRRTLIELFSSGSVISELLLGGAIGTGKTSCAALAQCYVVYRISCLKNPVRYYNLMDNSKIVMGLYSITMTQAADTIFYKMRNLIDASPYFRDNYPRNRKVDSVLRFGSADTGAMDIIFGSRDVHAIGKDLHSVVLDESNFMQSAKDKDVREKAGQAYELYQACITRMESRFMRAGGTIPGLMTLQSSKRSVTDFLENRLRTLTKGKYRQGMRGQISEHAYYMEAAIWEAKPPETYKLPKFIVMVGDRLHSSRILQDGEVFDRTRQVVEVPGEYIRAFTEDPDQALRELAGIATLSITPLIREKESLLDAIRQDMVHPFTDWSVVAGMQDDVKIEDYFRKELITRVDRSRIRPQINPDTPRYIHVDLSLKRDHTGFAMGHPSGMVRRRITNPDGTTSFAYKPFIVVDFLLEIVPPVGSETDLSKILNFILYLRQIFPLRKVTTDGFQSAFMLQLLLKQGIESEVLSVDRTDKPYLSMRGMFSDRCIAMCEHPQFLKEATYLEHDIIEEKVDHPQKFPDGTPGAKDCADGLAGVTWNILEDERARAGLPILEDGASAGSRSSDTMSQQPAGAEPDKPVAQPKRGNLNWDRLRQNVR